MATTPFLDTPQARLDRAHTALLVIDMQNDFCAEDGYIETVVGMNVAACRAIVAPIMALVADARSAGVPVIWVRAIYDNHRLPPGMLAKLSQRGADVCATGSRGAEFYQVQPAPGEMVFEKHSYSAFAATDLEARLRAKGIRSVAIAGVQTNVCVETTLRDAVCVGFYAALVSDCVAAPNPALHDATVRNIQFLFGDVLDRAALASIWRAAS